ncbi:MAG: transposase [Chloroflexi bacterium]|nr:transposase [Chloroflexota bacterium]
MSGWRSLRGHPAEPTAEMRQLRTLLTEQGRFPTRRTWERRLARLPATLPAQIGCLGRHLVVVLRPWDVGGRAAAIDRTVLRAKGGVWHQKDREAGLVPHTSIATEAGWTKSGWHGWVYGWKLHLVTTVAAVWLPLAADLTPANTADNEHAPVLLADLPRALRFLWGDTSDNDPDRHTRCATAGVILVASSRGRARRTDAGAKVRQVFHALRSKTIEHFNQQCKRLFGGHGQVPTRGRTATRRHVLGAVFVYQLLLRHRVATGRPLRVGLKPCLQAA